MRDESDTTTGRGVRQPDAGDARDATGRPEQSGEQSERGGLAGAIRPEEGQAFSGGEREGDPIHRPARAERADDIRGRDERGHRA